MNRISNPAASDRAAVSLDAPVTPRVKVFTKTYPPDVYCGAGVHVTHLTRELSKLTEVSVNSFGGQVVDTPNLTVRGIAPLTAPRGLPIDRVIDGLMRSAQFAGQDPRADVIHAHDWYSYIGGFWAKQIWDLPLVVTVHSLEPMRPWKVGQIGAGGYRVSSWMERTGLMAADRIIVVSRAGRADVMRLFPVAPEKITIIHNGVDVEIFTPTADSAVLRRHGIDPDRPYILFVGRVTRQKGIEYLLEASRHIVPHIQIVICAGLADEAEYRASCLAHVERLRQEGRVIHWLEGLSGGALAPLYSQALAFCCPSVYEGFALVNLEAMACATPVIASDIGGNVEQIDHDRTGLLVPLPLNEDKTRPIDPERYIRGLADAITRIATDTDLRRRLTSAALREVRECHHWQAIARNTLAVYRDVIIAHASAS